MNLRELLAFPKRFEVNKGMNKEKFLKHANLTVREANFLKAYMKDFDILYDIAFPNQSEMLVLYTEALRPDTDNEYFMRTYVTFVAQSFPYDCLIVVNFCGLLKLYILDERRNKLNMSRSVIEQWNASESIHFTPYTSSDTPIFESLRKEISSAYNSDDLHDRWKHVIRAYYGPCEMLNRFRNNATDIAIYKTDLLEAAIGKNALPQIRNKSGSEEFLSDIFDRVCIDPDNNAEERAFVQFCAVHCRKLYNEAVENAWQTFSEEEWLIEYINACNNYSQAVFNRSIDTECIFPIKTCFWEEYEPSKNEYYFFDADILREYLWRFFE